MTAMLKKRLPVGIENFEKIRRDGFYYVDKTDLIKELLENWGEVNLFTRPRRFGKTLNMSMFQCFFEIGCDKSLFDGLRIAKESTLCETYMGKFPVISISLKGIDAADYETARNMMVKVVNEEARRFQFLTESSRLTDTQVTLKGSADGYALAVWTEGGYAYAVSVTKKITKDEILRIVEEIVKK